MEKNGIGFVCCLLTFLFLVLASPQAYSEVSPVVASPISEAYQPNPVTPHPDQSGFAQLSVPNAPAAIYGLIGLVLAALLLASLSVWWLRHARQPRKTDAHLRIAARARKTRNKARAEDAVHSVYDGTTDPRLISEISGERRSTPRSATYSGGWGGRIGPLR